jgi:hypothetical protein
LDEFALDLKIRGIPTFESGPDRIGFPCLIHRIEATARLRAWNDIVMSCPRGCTDEQLADALAWET